MKRTTCRSFWPKSSHPRRAIVFAFAVATSLSLESTFAQPAESQSPQPPASEPPAARPNQEQVALDRAFAEMLSGATLEGSFTSTGAGRDSTKLSQEKYTIGEVRRLAGDFWLIPARIQYGEHDVTLPVTVPIRWAGDTPIIVVDSVPLPGFGTVSARVMFFADHYAGYWKHGDHGGHLFGVIRRKTEPAASAAEPAAAAESSVDDPPAHQKPDE